METCSATTKAGKPCDRPRYNGLTVCYGHSGALAAQAKAAAAASAEVRKAKAEAREEIREEAKIRASLGIDHWIAVAADENDEAIARALVAAALENPHGPAMRLLLERRLGKVADHLVTETTNPHEMDEAELLAYIARLDGSDNVVPLSISA